MSTPDFFTRERLIETYRRKAAHYDTTSRLYPVPGYPQLSQRAQAVEALRLREGDTVVEVACGTGLNFGLVEGAIGRSGRLIGVDLTDAMLARAAARARAHGWSNVTLVQSDAAEFSFPDGVDGILSTYALTQVPGSRAVIAHGASALKTGRRWVVLDLKLPDGLPRWLSRAGAAVVPTAASLDDWVAKRPWEAIQRAMRDELVEVSWSELSFGTAFLAVGCAPTRGARGT